MKDALRRFRRHLFNWALSPIVQRYPLPVADLLATYLARMEGNPAYLNFLRHGFFLLRQGDRMPLDDHLELAEIVAACLSISSGNNPAHEQFSKHGFHLLRKSFDAPIPDGAEVMGDFWNKRTDLVGLDMNDRQALDLLQVVFPPFVSEFRERFSIDKTDDPRQFFLINGTYMAVDAHVYYALIRHVKPKRIIEIGAGNSTILAGAACLENQRETGQTTHLLAIEPYPSATLKQGVSGLSQLIEARLQEVDLKLFGELGSGDILFIDSSHVLRAGNDVHLEYLEILPRLAPGVLVHIHDISLPRHYPRVYFDNQLYWNEQYLLQAFLAFNSRFEVIWPGNYMALKYPENVLAVFPELNIMRQHYPMSEPTAFWIRSRQ